MATVRNPATHYPFKRPFFKDSCVVKRNSKVLKEGVDFYFGHLYVTGSYRHARIAYGSIWLYNKVNLNGLTVTAEQLPHGEATQAQIDLEAQENGNVIAPVRFWDDVLKEHYYPPIDIQFDEENWRGELELMNAIKAVGDTLLAKPPTDDDVYKIAESWLVSLENTFNRSPIHQHLISTNNPHSEEYNWIGALVRDGYAANAAKLYGYSLAQLTTYVNERSAKASDLAPKLTKLGRKVINSELTFKNGVGFITSKDTLLAINKRSAALLGKGNVKVTSHTTQPIKFVSGANNLTLYPDARGLQFNGQPLLTRNTIGPHIPKPGAANAGFKFVTNANLEITGDGTPGNPARFAWVKQPNEPDLLRVSRDRGNSKEIAGHVSLLKTYNATYDSKLVIGRAVINDVTVTEETVITKGNLGLPNVENYSDLDMPLSRPQQLELRKYSLKDHTHSPFEFGIVDATDKIAGRIRFGAHPDFEDYENVTPLPFDVANQYHAMDAIDLSEFAQRSVNLLPSAALKMIRYGNSGKGIVDTLITGNMLRITKEVPYFIGTRYTAPISEFNLDDVFKGTVGIAYVYVSLDTATDAVSYTVTTTETVENETTTLAGHVSRNAAGEYRAVLRHRTRLGNFLELSEHANNPGAHTGTVVDKNSVGLGSLVNMEPSTVMLKPTFAEVFNSWHRFSHGAYSEQVAGHHAGGGSAQPANVNALSGWVYDSINDSIKMPYNCGSFAGFVSPEKYGNYVFDTILSSTDADDDQIGVLIGFHVDENGREHTLSLICSNAGGNVNLWLEDNYNQAVSGNALLTARRIWNSKSVAVEPVKPWSEIGSKRIRVERKGDRIVVDNFQFTGWAGGEQNKLIETIVFWLNSPKIHFVVYPETGSPVVSMLETNDMVIRGAKYLGRSNFGYVTLSQPNATFKNLMRPDEDSRNYYATLPTLLDNVSYFSKLRAFIETTPFVRSGYNHLQEMPNGIGINTYAGVVNVPWTQYMYDNPVTTPGLFTGRRLGMVNMSKDVFRPISTLFEDASSADNFQRPFDIETLTGQ